MPRTWQPDMLVDTCTARDVVGKRPANGRLHTEGRHRRTVPMAGQGDEMNKRGTRAQRGITGLETAIVLIAFVVVASVFAFTILSAGVFASEANKQTIHAGLKLSKL